MPRVKIIAHILKAKASITGCNGSARIATVVYRAILKYLPNLHAPMFST